MSKAREMAAEWLKKEQSIDRRGVSFIYLTHDFLAGWDSALEAAAEESEKWWELFQKDETRKYANPNQIAARIRHLKENYFSSPV